MSRRTSVKPRLADAPQGIVGGTRSPRTDNVLLGALEVAPRTSSTATSATVPAGSTAGSLSARGALPTALSSPRPQHISPEPTPGATASPRDPRALSASASPRDSVTRRGSARFRRAPEHENPGPLQPDTRQAELVAELVADTGASHSLWGTLRGRTPRTARKPVEEDPADRAGQTWAGTLFPRRDDAAVSTEQLTRSSNSSLDSLLSSHAAAPTSPPGLGSASNSRRGSKIFSRTKSPTAAPTEAQPAPASAVPPLLSPPKAQSKGFFGKLFGRHEKQREREQLSVSASPARGKKQIMAASELAKREAELEAAGFAQLPGTLLSRATGDTLDAKYRLRWDQFELVREIGEGAYAVVYLARVKLADGSVKDVALKVSRDGGLFAASCEFIGVSLFRS